MTDNVVEDRSLRNERVPHQTHSSGQGTSGRRAGESTRDIMLAQFYSTLRTTFLATQQGTSVPDNQDDMEIAELLEETPSWEHAYEIELKLVYVMNEPQVRTEWHRRLAEAASLNLPFAAGISLDAGETLDLPAMRAHLLRLINDLQWYYQQRILRRDAARRLSERVAALFVCSFILFSMMLFLQVVALPPMADEVANATSHQEN